jgi:hypothetical protein
MDRKTALIQVIKINFKINIMATNSKDRMDKHTANLWWMHKSICRMRQLLSLAFSKGLEMTYGTINPEND